MDFRPARSAMALAREAARGRPFSAPPDGRQRRLRVAVGDPQAPLDAFMAVLAGAGLLADSGRLRSGVQLFSVGDHFDWGRPDQRDEAAADGLAILAWLALHPADQVLLCAGNHDLSRVGELATLDDAAFSALQTEADAMPRGERFDPRLERAFLERHPQFPSSLLASRDLSSFRAVQRTWISFLLDRRRLRLAHAAGPSLLVSHAGITLDELSVLGVPLHLESDAPALARALDRVLETAWATRAPGPLSIPGLYRPGSAAGGEGGGIPYHRASLVPGETHLVGRSPPRRRFSPFRLPAGLTQVIGHIRDAKSRELLGLPVGPARDGVLRQLTVAGRRIDYRHGVRPLAGPSEAVVLYVDGGLRSCPPGDYQLLQLDPLAAWGPGAVGGT